MQVVALTPCVRTLNFGIEPSGIKGRIGFGFWVHYPDVTINTHVMTITMETVLLIRRDTTIALVIACSEAEA